jgi:hypothetical protein
LGSNDHHGDHEEGHEVGVAGLSRAAEGMASPEGPAFH